MTQSDLQQRGYEQLRAGNYEEAKRLFREHEERAGTAAGTRTQLRQAEARLAAGDLKDAAERYEQVRERNPCLVDVYLGLARISLLTGQLDSARVHTTAAMRLGPDQGLSWALLGLVHEAQGDVEIALDHLREAVALSPSVFLCQYNYGRVLAVSGRPAEGLAALLQATGLEPRNPDGFCALGIAYKQAGQYANALRALERATALAPRSLDAWATLADVRFAAGEYEAAREGLDQALAACGDHPALLEKALAAAMMLSDTPGAIAYVERELRLVPAHAQGWLNLAHLALQARDFVKSESAARELLRRDPRNWQAWFHLGNLFDAVPLEQDAEQAYREAIALAPTQWQPLANLAGLLLQMKARNKNAEALPLLEKALTLVPRGEWLVHYNLALAHTKLGHPERALELTRRIQREAPPADPMVAQARKLESNLQEAAARRN